MFKIIDALNNIDHATLCIVCDQHLDILNNTSIKYQVKPLYAHNLNTHLHFTHGMGIEVIETT